MLCIIVNGFQPFHSILDGTAALDPPPLKKYPVNIFNSSFTELLTKILLVFYSSFCGNDLKKSCMYILLWKSISIFQRKKSGNNSLITILTSRTTSCNANKQGFYNLVHTAFCLYKIGSCWTFPINIRILKYPGHVVRQSDVIFAVTHTYISWMC